MVPCAVSSILTNHPNKKALKISAKGFGKVKIRSYIYDIRLNALVVELVDTAVLEAVALRLRVRVSPEVQKVATPKHRKTKLQC